MAVDGRGLPLSIVLAPGNTNDVTAFDRVLGGIRVPLCAGGRPRTAPDRVKALGYHDKTATRLVTEAGGTWSQYAPGDHQR